MIALVTGAGSLLAEGITRALNADGWSVVMSDLEFTNIEPVAKELENTWAIHMDVRDLDEVRARIAEVQQEHGRIEALINCAGGMNGPGLEIADSDFVDSDPRDWHAIVDANLFGAMNCSYAVLPGMLDARSGSIVSISAGRGLHGGKRAAAYSAAKAGIIMFSQSLALETGSYNVRVNCIVPGSADTRRPKIGPPPKSPLGRYTSAADIGAAVAFLVSPSAAHITASTIDVSGGTALH